MPQNQAMIAIKPKTRDRLYGHKRPGVSYDDVINEALEVLEKIEEHRSPPASNGTGMINQLGKEEVIQ